MKNKNEENYDTQIGNTKKKGKERQIKTDKRKQTQNLKSKQPNSHTNKPVLAAHLFGSNKPSSSHSRVSAEGLRLSSPQTASLWELAPQH